MIANIQLFRFCSALLVVFYHMAGYYENAGGNANVAALINSAGFAGVDFFFVISGFVIWYSTANLQDVREKLMFLLKRVARVYLGYWPFFLMLLALFWFLNQDNLGKYNVWFSAFLVPQPIKTNLHAISWTLFYEMYFYLLVFFLLFLPKHWRLPAMTVITLSFCLGSVVLDRLYGAYSEGGFFTISLYLRFLVTPWLLEFFLGCIVAHIVMHQYVSTSYRWLFMIVGLAVFLIGLMVNNMILDNTMQLYYNHHLRLTLFGFSGALLILGMCLFQENQSNAVHKTKILLGESTYSLYLFHWIALLAFAWTGLQRTVIDGAFSIELSYVVLFAAIVAYSIGHSYYLEMPLYRLARRKIHRLW